MLCLDCPRCHHTMRQWYVGQDPYCPACLFTCTLATIPGYVD